MGKSKPSHSNDIRAPQSLHDHPASARLKPVKGQPIPDRLPSAASPASPESAAADAAAAVPEEARKFAPAFLPDAEVARHILFRFLVWTANWFAKPLHGFGFVNFREQPKDKGILFYTRHSTHNADILPTAAITYEATGKVARMLLHRLILAGFPLIKYVGGVAGERKSAVALLRAKFFTGVIPGGADEGLVGHENAYRLHWPSKRVGFAKVAMEADARLVPFFVRNGEESRWNPILELWHLVRGYRLYDSIVAANIPVVSSLVYTLGHVVWFSCTWVQIPIPVRCTLIFGAPVPYDRATDTTETVVARCHDALQQLIIDHQPNALEGRNYTRAMAERWVEWRQAKPGLCRAIESVTPAFVKRYLTRLARGGKKKA